MTKNVDAIRRLFGAINSQVGNLPSLPGIFPDYPAPIVRNDSEGEHEIVMARWGMPSSQFALMESAKKRATKLEAKGQRVDFNEMLRSEPDSGVTNIRNTSSMHWQRWLGPENRCLVPFTSFSEYDTIDGKKEGAGLACDRREPALARIRWHLDELDLRAQSEGSAATTAGRIASDRGNRRKRGR
jgi:putative SOS response-associated peptidase YedK